MLVKYEGDIEEGVVVDVTDPKTLKAISEKVAANRNL